MCTKGSGTNSVKPPVTFCRARVRTMWRAQDRGCSTAPNMIVTFERSPTSWAVRWASSHSLGVDLVRAQDRPDRVVEDLGGRAGQGLEAGVLQAAEVVGQRLVEARAPSVTSRAVKPWMWISGATSWTARATSM